MTFSHRSRIVALPLLAVAVCLFAAPPVGRGEIVLPPAPEGMILDRGHVLLPEQAAELSARLKAAARERSIFVYVVTVPELGVPSSIEKERLSNMAHFYADGWVTGRVGVVLLVDDDSGDAIVVASEETDRRFPPFRRSMLMRDPLRAVQREKLLRDKTERTALVLLETLSGLQDEQRRNARRDRKVDVVMAVVGLAGLSLIGLAWWKRPEPPTLSQ